jgi:hypothetical protein
VDNYGHLRTVLSGIDCPSVALARRGLEPPSTLARRLTPGACDFAPSTSALGSVNDAVEDPEPLAGTAWLFRFPRSIAGSAAGEPAFGARRRTAPWRSCSLPVSAWRAAATPLAAAFVRPAVPVAPLDYISAYKAMQGSAKHDEKWERRCKQEPIPGTAGEP